VDKDRHHELLLLAAAELHAVLRATQLPGVMLLTPKAAGSLASDVGKLSILLGQLPHRKLKPYGFVDQADVSAASSLAFIPARRRGLLRLDLAFSFTSIDRQHARKRQTVAFEGKPGGS
jgi:hypothetical protein